MTLTGRFHYHTRTSGTQITYDSEASLDLPKVRMYVQCHDCSHVHVRARTCILLHFWASSPISHCAAISDIWPSSDNTGVYGLFTHTLDILIITTRISKSVKLQQEKSFPVLTIKQSFFFFFFFLSSRIASKIWKTKFTVRCENLSGKKLMQDVPIDLSNPPS